MKLNLTSFLKTITPYQDLLHGIVFLQAFVGMIGSLYFSTYGDPVRNIAEMNLFDTSRGLPPCELCWYARVLMYPMVFIAALAWIKKDRKFMDYILVLSVPGILLGIYHYMLQKIPSTPVLCGGPVSCATIDVQYFGFITIPLLGLVGFLIISTAAFLYKLIEKYYPRIG